MPVALPRTLMPSLQELTAFEAAGRHGSFTRASQELALTQGAISKQIRQMEETLGVVLFNRVQGRIVLTMLGEHYMRSARRILRDYEASTHEIIASGGSDSTLKIAVLPTFAARWLIPRLPGFLAGHLDLTINVTTELEPFDFAEKSVDAAVHYGAPSWAQAEATHLFDEAIIAVASPGYLSANGLLIASDLIRATLLQQATRPNLWGHWFGTVGIDHPNPYRGPMFDQFSMTSEAAVAGLGVALVPAFLVQRELAEGQLTSLAERPLSGTGAYYAVVPLSKQHDPVIGGFVRWLVAETRALRPAMP